MRPDEGKKEFTPTAFALSVCIWTGTGTDGIHTSYSFYGLKEGIPEELHIFKGY